MLYVSRVKGQCRVISGSLTLGAGRVKWQGHNIGTHIYMCALDVTLPFDLCTTA